MPGWGGASWGATTWGDGSEGDFVLVSALAVRENVLRLAFSEQVYFSGILDFGDASAAARYGVSIVPGSVGLDGLPVRPVAVVLARLPTSAEDGIPARDEGRFVDLLLDRPLSAVGALYTVSVSNVSNVDRSETIGAQTSSRIDAVYRRLEPSQVETATPTRDFANPQTLEGALDPLPDPRDPFGLGTLRVDDTGDYALDEGVQNLKKRVLRRAVTTKNAFAHLPGYGAGVGDHGKKLAVPGNLADMAADLQSQIASEPDVAKVLVAPVVDPFVPGLMRLRIFVKPKTGQPQRYDLPVNTDG